MAPSPACLPRVLLQEILAFGPRDGARLALTGRAGLVAIPRPWWDYQGILAQIHAARDHTELDRLFAVVDKRARFLYVLFLSCVLAYGLNMCGM